MKKNSWIKTTAGDHASHGLVQCLARYAVIAAFTLLAGCGGDDSESETSTPTVAPDSPRIMTGRVLSSATGNAVPNAQITVQGTAATTDANGDYTINNIVLEERILVNVAATGFASTAHVAHRGSIQNLTVNVSLLPVAHIQTIDPAVGGTISVPNSAAQVQLAANSLVRSDGAAINGNVTVEITPILVAVNSSWMPGDFTATAGAQTVSLESYGAITVTLKDAQGAKVNLASGKTATIRIPTSTRSNGTPATLRLYYFNESNGRWMEEGTAALMGMGPGSYYEGTVSHFSTWHASQQLQAIQVNGCVADVNGTRIANAVVMSDGIDYSGTTAVRTDANGNFSLPIPQARRAILTGQVNGLVTNTRDAGPSNTTVDLGTTCLALSGNNTGINVKLTWGGRPADLDSHLIAPDGQYVYYGSKGSLTAAPYVNLDVDDISSYGPEVVTFTRLQIGTYQYYIHNYSEDFNPGMTGSPARVELKVNNNTSLFTPPAGEGNNLWWHVFSLVIDANCNITVTPVGAWSNAEPTVTRGTATYCAWVGSAPPGVTTTTQRNFKYSRH